MGKRLRFCEGVFLFFAFVVSGHATFALPYTVSVGLFFKSPKIRLHKGEIDLKYTKNYQLNQWDAADRVLRTDFNADNQKLDAAIAEAKATCPYVHLLTASLPADAVQLDLDVSTLDLTRYYRLDLHITLKAGADYADAIMLRCNNLSEGYVNEDKAHGYLAYCALGSMTEYFCQLCFHVYLGSAVMGSVTYGCLDYTYWEKGLVHCSDTPAFYGLALSPAEITSLNLVSGTNGKLLGDGLSVQLYGLKK